MQIILKLLFALFRQHSKVPDKNQKPKTKKTLFAQKLYQWWEMTWKQKLF